MFRMELEHKFNYFVKSIKSEDCLAICMTFYISYDASMTSRTTEGRLKFSFIKLGLNPRSSAYTLRSNELEHD